MTTVKELYAEAQLLNIRGRSKMNKAALQAAIEKAKKKSKPKEKSKPKDDPVEIQWPRPDIVRSLRSLSPT